MDSKAPRRHALRRIVSSIPAFLCVLGGAFLLLHLGGAWLESATPSFRRLFELDSEPTAWDVAVVCLTVALAGWIVKAGVAWVARLCSQVDTARWHLVPLEFLRAAARSLPQSPADLIDRYRASPLARRIEAVQPLTLVLAVVGLGASSYGLWLASQDMDRRALEAQATFRMLLDAKLDEAPFDVSSVGGPFTKCPPDIPADHGTLAITVEMHAALGAPLHGIRAIAKQLSGLHLRDVHIDRATFAAANLANSDFSDSTLTNSWFFCTDLESANFRDATLRRADFRIAHLRNADFSGATLHNVDFRRADLSDANFLNTDIRAANLHGARIDNADFRGATGLTKGDIERACVTRETRLPQGLPLGWKPPVDPDSCPEPAFRSPSTPTTPPE